MRAEIIKTPNNQKVIINGNLIEIAPEIDRIVPVKVVLRTPELIPKEFISLLSFEIRILY
jgi:hypothetical protein